MFNLTSRQLPASARSSQFFGEAAGLGMLPWLGIVLATVAGGLAIAMADFNALYICISLLACAFILLDFRVGIALLIVLMPLSASTILPRSIGGITGLNPLNLLLLGTLASSLIQRPGSIALWKFAPPPLIWRYVLPMCMAALLGMSHVDEISPSLRPMGLLSFDTAGGYLRDMLIRPLFMILFALLVGAALVRFHSLKLFLFSMLLSTWCIGLTAIVFVYLSGTSLETLASDSARDFFSPLGLHANSIGRFYAIAYGLMLFSFSATKDYRLRVLLLASMGMVVIALLLTFSRGAFLGFVVINILFLISRRQIVTLLIGACLSLGLLLMLPDAVFNRVGTGWGQGLNAISAGRLDSIWQPLLPEVWASPLWGHGLGSILWSDAMQAGTILKVSHPHNAFLQAVLDMGLLGLFLLCSYFAGVWRGFRQLSQNPSLDPVRRGFYEGAAAGIAALLLTGMSGSSLMPVSEQSFLWVAIGMMYGEQWLAREKAHV